MAYYEATTHSQVKRYEDKRSGATRYLVRYRTDQGRLTMKRGFSTMRAAKSFLVDQEAAKASGTFVPQSAGRAVVGELAPAWLAHKKALYSASHSVALEGAWRNHVEPVWGGTPISEVRPTAVRDWITELSATRSATVCLRAHGVLAGILDDAVADQRIVRNPARGIALPRRSEVERRYLTPVEVEAVAAAVRPAWRVLFLVLTWSGLRWGEAIALRPCDLEPVRRRILVQRAAKYAGREWHVTDTKGHRRRSVALPKSVWDELTAHAAAVPDPDGLGAERLLWPPTSDADFIHPPSKASWHTVKGKRYLRVHWLEAALNAARLPYLSVHKLRHTAASLAVSAGANVKALQRMLGHRSAKDTLDTYSDLFDSDLDDVALRLDQVRETALREHKLSTKTPENPMSEQNPPELAVQVRA